MGLAVGVWRFVGGALYRVCDVSDSEAAPASGQTRRGRDQRMGLDHGAQRAGGARGSESAGLGSHARPGSVPSPSGPRFLYS